MVLGQHASAMEHAAPEQFCVDKSQCRYVDENGLTQNPALPDGEIRLSAVITRLLSLALT